MTQLLNFIFGRRLGTQPPAGQTGVWGEKKACEFLQNRGYKCLMSNYKGPGGEIDLIMEKEGALIFVEVKTRSPGKLRPLAAVTSSKRRKIIKTATTYLRTLKNPRQRVRFDVVEVYLSENQLDKIHHVENAFDMSPWVDFG